jgi:hypothetical protein
MGQENSQISSQLPQFGVAPMSQYLHPAYASTDQSLYNYVSPNSVSNSASNQYEEAFAQNTLWQPQNMDPAQSQYDVDILSDNSNHNSFDNYTNSDNSNHNSFDNYTNSDNSNHNGRAFDYTNYFSYDL